MEPATMRSNPDTYPADRVPLMAQIAAFGAAACIVATMIFAGPF